MALPVLRPVPRQDPRPTVRSLDVLARAYAPGEQEIMAWAVNRGILMDAPDLRACILAGVQAGCEDAYIAARSLEEAFGFHCDFTFVLMLDEVIRRAPERLPGAVREWVIRTSLRFPGRPGDLIVFRDRWRHLRTGRVGLVRNSEASAVVTFEASGREEVIWAENVVENRTTGENPDNRLTLPGKITPFR